MANGNGPERLNGNERGIYSILGIGVVLIGWMATTLYKTDQNVAKMAAGFGIRLGTIERRLDTMMMSLDDAREDRGRYELVIAEHEFRIKAIERVGEASAP